MLKIKDSVSSDVLTKVYGFKKREVYESSGIFEYVFEEEHCITLLQRGDRSISIVIPSAWDTDCVPISDVVFKLVTDGLVEIAP